MAQNLDPGSDGRGVLQFKTGLASLLKQKLAIKDGAPIDRQNDIQVLWNFYLQHKSRCRIDDIQREETLRESGSFSTEMGARDVKMREVYATLRALLNVLEILVGQSPTDRLGRKILEEIIKKTKGSDAVLRGELMPYNIVPLDVPSSVTNIIGFFPEVRAATAAVQDCKDLPRFPYDASQLRHRHFRPFVICIWLPVKTAACFGLLWNLRKLDLY